MMFKRRAILAGLLVSTLGGSVPLRALGPDFYDVPNLGGEYEVDRYMGDAPWAWRDRFRSQATGFFITGGSLNIRHLYIEEELKVRFPLVTDRFWFRFQRERIQGLERNDSKNELEFEYSPWKRWFFSFLGEPTFHKAESDAGAAVRWGLEEGRSVKLSYLWPDFDANYAFHNQSVNEGFERFYRRLPQEARLRIVWVGQSLSLFLKGRLARPWERTQETLPKPGTRYVQEGSQSEAALDLRYRWSLWSAAAEGETWRSQESIAFEPAVPARDRAVTEERSSLRGSLERALAHDWRARVGGGFVTSRGVERYFNQPASHRSHKVNDALGFLFVYHDFTPRLTGEIGYVYDRQGQDVLANGTRLSSRRSQNRGKLALQRDIGDNASFRLVTGWELDGRDVGRFSYFDGGTLQFQATFP